MDGICELDHLVKLFLEEQPRAVSSGLFFELIRFSEKLFPTSCLETREGTTIWQHFGNFVKKVEIVPLSV